MTTPKGVIRVLILSSNPKELEPAAQFLLRRQYLVIIKPNMRDALNEFVKTRPDWVFLSMNLSPMIDRFVYVLKKSFNIDPILFGDVLDHHTFSRLDKYRGHVITAKLTGPNIQMKINQILEEMESAGSGRLRAPSSSGLRKADFHIHMKGEGPGSANAKIIQQGSPHRSSGGVRSSGSSGPAMGSVVPGPGAAPGSNPRAKNQSSTDTTALIASDDAQGAAAIKQIHVMVTKQADAAGYLVMGNSDPEAKVGKPGQEDMVFGPYMVDAEGIPQWEQLRAMMVPKDVDGSGEVLSCFVPKPAPLPTYSEVPGDKLKLAVRLSDIPTQVPLPCQLFVYLAQNQKFVCLIKRGGQLSEIQQDRLTKLGLKSLMIAREDVQVFNRFYVRENLSPDGAFAELFPENGKKRAL